MNRRLYILIGISIIALVLVRIHAQRYLGFEGFTDGEKRELLIAKMKGCGHCEKAMPEFKKLVAASTLKLADGSSVTIRMLDASTDRAEVESLGVNGFPTILYRSNSKVLPYEGPRTYEGVMGFLQTM